MPKATRRQFTDAFKSGAVRLTQESGYASSVFVDRLILMLQAGERRLDDLRALRREAGLMRLLDREAFPDPDTLGDWLRRMGRSADGTCRTRGAGVRDVRNARLLRRDGHVTYTLDADAMLIEGEKRDAQWSDKGCAAACCCWGFC